MDETSYLVASDILSGVIAASASALQGKKKELYMPFIENVVYSIVGRMGASKITTSYILTTTGKSSLIVLVASGVSAYLLKAPNKMEKVFTSIASDALADGVVSALFGADRVIFSGLTPK